MVARGDIKVKGVIPPEKRIDPEPFMVELAKRNIKILETIKKPYDIVVHIYTMSFKEVKAYIADVVLVRNVAMSSLIISLFTFRLCRKFVSRWCFCCFLDQ